MPNYKIEDLEGVGPVLGAKFRAVGVNNTNGLLKVVKTKKQRQELAEKTGISEDKILTFSNMVDLYRVKGIGSEYSELLEAAGVDTVPELAQRNAENLTKKMEEVNAEKKLVRRTPPQKIVEKWVAQAKELPRALEY
jgi:predicted flap endonuclease-1-like 5' DNA nuclease